MQMTYIGHNHVHDMDFKIERPDGCGDYLALLIKSPALFHINGQDVYTSPNIFFLYQKGTPQYYEAYKQSFSNDWFNFTLDAGDEDFLKKLHIPFEKPIPINNMQYFSLLIKNMTYEYYAGQNYGREALDHYMRLFLLKIAQVIPSLNKGIEKIHHDKFSLLRSKIYSAPYEKWCIEGLAHEATLSPYYFQRLYKKNFGVTCLKDIINARIEYAKYYLSQTNLSIKYIAETCGYENDVHFMRQFKSSTGLTPSEFRLQQYKS